MKAQLCYGAEHAQPSVKAAGQEFVFLLWLVFRQGPVLLPWVELRLEGSLGAPAEPLVALVGLWCEALDPHRRFVDGGPPRGSEPQDLSLSEGEQTLPPRESPCVVEKAGTKLAQEMRNSHKTRKTKTKRCTGTEARFAFTTPLVV